MIDENTQIQLGLFIIGVVIGILGTIFYKRTFENSQSTSGEKQ